MFTTLNSIKAFEFSPLSSVSSREEQTIIFWRHTLDAQILFALSELAQTDASFGLTEDALEVDC